MSVIKLEKTVIPAQEINPSITHAEMVSVIKSGDFYEGFFGGVEVPIADVDKMYIEDLSFGEHFDTTISLDKSKSLIRICKMVHSKAWVNSTSEIFQKFVDNYPVESFLTKSDFQTRLDSTDYKLPTTEDF